MKLTILVSTAIALVASLASAAPAPLATPFDINIGIDHDTEQEVAWQAGDSQCNHAILGPVGASICGMPFALDNMAFVVTGCGATMTIRNVADGSLYATCFAFAENEFCNVETQFHCF